MILLLLEKMRRSRDVKEHYCSIVKMGLQGLMMMMRVEAEVITSRTEYDA